MEISSVEVLEKTLKRYGEKVMKEVSNKYGIELNSLLKLINIEVKEVEEIERKALSKIPMPFTGVMCVENCNAIRLNHGLYTQCTNEHSVSKNGYDLCKTCVKQTEKNSNGKPTYGYIQDRIELGDEFKDPKGKCPVSYGNIMEKLNISRKDVEEEAERLGLKLSEKMFEVKKSQRGRPKKSTDVVDTASESSEQQKRPRGRPKKEKKTVTEDSSDILKNLITEDLPETRTNKVEEEEPKLEEEHKVEEEEPDDSDEEELAVTEFTYKGKKYLKAGDNTLYDVNTHEEIGMWDPEKNKIILD
jgi:hypothetical protein|tara:strand:+ start:518 stop:1423 length:906 start_codon:yes stop_codon:yes gene_type:complete